MSEKKLINASTIARMAGNIAAGIHPPLGAPPDPENAWGKHVARWSVWLAREIAEEVDRTELAPPGPTHGAREPQGSPAGKDYAALYFDLLLQVGNVTKGETRHETAKRYIRQAEEPNGMAAQADTKEPSLD